MGVQLNKEVLKLEREIGYCFKGTQLPSFIRSAAEMDVGVEFGTRSQNHRDGAL